MIKNSENLNSILKILIFQPGLPHYRLPIFKKLSQQKDLDVTIFYGKTPFINNVEPDGIKAFKTKPLRISWGYESLTFDFKWLSKVWSGDQDVFAFVWDLRQAFLVPCLIIARLRGKGTVLWGHGYSKNETPWRKFLRDSVGRFADAVVVYSKTIKNQLIKEGWNKSRVFAAPNTQDQTVIQTARNHWISNPLLLSNFQKKHKVSPKNTVLFCSRLETANRVDLLIQAQAEIQKEIKNSKLIIIGTGPDEDRLKDLAESLGIENNVHFLGSIYDQKNLAPWFLSAGVYCYPSNIGLSILHAFGYGLPVVTDDNIKSHNPEIEAFRNGKNGFLYRKGDVLDLSSKLKTLLKNKKLRTLLSKEARQTALKGYPIFEMVNGLKESFRFAANRFFTTKKKNSKMGILFGNTAPYHDARMASLAKLFNVTCLEKIEDNKIMIKKEKLRPYEKKFLFLNSFGSYNNSQKSLSKIVEAELKGIEPSVVSITGWYEKTALSALSWCLRNKIPAILMTDSTERDFRRWSYKEYIKKRIIKYFNSAVVSGQRSKDYLVKLGFSRTRIFYGFDVVDNEHFARKINSSRKKINFPLNYFLSVSRFVSKKNLPFVLRAYFQYTKSAKKPWSLVLLGDGPQRAKIETLASSLGIRELVIFPGFTEYEEIPYYYRHSRAFLLASFSEQWGLVVNEALAASTPVIVSKNCGCAPDLVKEGKNGFTFDPKDEKALTNLFINFSNNSLDLTQMGKNGSKIISNWTCEKFAQNLKNAYEILDQDLIPKLNFFDRVLLWSLIHCPDFIYKVREV